MLLSGKVFSQITIRNTEVTEASLAPLLTGISNTALTSAPTLNSFFATKISTYLSEASDLSLSKSFAVLDNTDGRLFLGGTFNAKQSIDQFQRFLFTAGVKVNVKDGFASLVGSDGFNNDIGVSVKTTIFGRGIIWFDEDPKTHKDKVENKRNEIKNELLVDFDDAVTKLKRYQYGESTIGKFVTKYQEKMKEEFAKKEAAYIIQDSLFNVSHTWWISADVYIPVTKSSYKTVPDFSTASLNTSIYRPFEFNVTYTNFWEKNKWIGNVILLPGVTQFTVKAGLLANNSASASIIESYSFDKYLTRTVVADTSFLAKLKSDDVYVGKLEKFLTPKVSARYVYMPLSFIGVSAAIEKYFGKIDDLNWRLGVPVSLKDKEGKSKINFELVWREIQKKHSIGLSIGLPIGNTIF